MPSIDVRGWKVHYEEFGAPELPPVVLVHGLMGEASTVASLAARLSSNFRVIAPDALGHGGSARPQSFTLEDQGAMLTGLVAALGYESAAMVGMSMGSYLVAQAAILDSQRVSHLVLVVTKAQGTTSSTAAYAARMGYDLSALAPEEAMALVSQALWSPHTSQDRREEILKEMVVSDPLTPKEQASVERSLAGFDLRPAMHTITAPTLVVSGLDDGLNPPEAGREVADCIPGARFEVYEHSGHMLAYEEADRLTADITGFLSA